MSKVGSNREAETLRQLQALGAKWQTELEAVDRNLGELQLLARQTAAELDRWGPRAGQAAQRLHDMESHLESYSRGDIKDLYGAAQEAQMRLFMMQIQQEQIEHKQRVLTTYHDTLAEAVALSELVRLEEAGQDSERKGQATVSERECTRRVIQAQEEERRRTARQIHDGPAQALANLVLRAEICERLMGGDVEQARRELGGLKKLVAQSLQETRGFIFDLRPMILDDLGLLPTLRRYCDALSENSKVPIRLATGSAEWRLPPAVEIVLLRVIQEAIRNALAHGAPTEVQVVVEEEGEGVKVSVQDNGRGCDGVAVQEVAQKGRRAGLSRMEQYVGSVDGKLTLWSEPGRGCIVTAIVPRQTEALAK